MTTALTLEGFQNDPQGRTYADVIARNGPALTAALSILSEPGSQQRMKDAELFFDLPALAAVVKLLGQHVDVSEALSTKPSNLKSAHRFKQAIGAAVRIIMEAQGWKKTNRKSAVGVGHLFNRAERYIPTKLVDIL